MLISVTKIFIYEFNNYVRILQGVAKVAREFWYLVNIQQIDIFFGFRMFKAQNYSMCSTQQWTKIGHFYFKMYMKVCWYK